MGTVIYHRQLRSLCTTRETLEHAKSILNLASVKTGRGTGFVANAAALPAVAAYLASEQLNANEVSLQSAATAACVKPRVFEDMLKTVCTALQLDEDKDGQHGSGGNPTYQSLVACHGLYPPKEAVRWMEQAEDMLPQVEMMKRRYGLHMMTSAIFFWVYNLMGNTLAEKTFCADYNFKPVKFKNILKGLDEHCGTVADLVRSALPKIQASQSTVPATASSSRFPSTAPFKLPGFSPQKFKSPIKSAMKGKERERELMMSRATSQKRTVAFSQSLLDPDEHADVPETPTKKRRIGSPTKPSLRCGMTLSSVTHEDASPAAFRTALTGPALTRSRPSSPRDPRAFPSPRTPSTRTDAAEPPSTPRQSNGLQASNLDNASPAQSPTSAVVTSTPSTSTHLPPAQPLTHPRKRFYPIFMDQQQWVAKDPKVERIWADAAAHRTHMIELYGHPLEHYRPVVS
ncbi:hypothetical protein F5J12DRAFT_837469 [Pisolithus orientalis]|uniref:uncharacterized protein n=1 Tax=Pisolithus orientalis TaxID=936130 RepID=UPI0022242E29|nr:uncharacterized protein F5J12DRAFT_837469 [Pisolithus orientalis]KAI6004503.1 hypothetical protein F5J12DRAFT_837469 [Pisolithus orientalis]